MPSWPARAKRGGDYENEKEFQKHVDDGGTRSPRRLVPYTEAPTPKAFASKAARRPSFPSDLAASEFPAKPGRDGHDFERAHLAMFQPIVQEGARLGTIYLRADLGEMVLPFRGLWLSSPPG